MIVVAEGVLSPGELESIRARLASGRFIDGAASATGAAKAEKRVLQLDREQDGQREPGEIVARALLRHRLVQQAVQPKITRHPTINRYEPGMSYGKHLDLPLMSGSVPTRADVSCTVFLSEPETYEGGELSIHADAAPLAFKCRAGDAVLYPADSIHEVKAVRTGTRLVAVTWFQSFVRDTSRRKILFDLALALETFERTSAETDAILHLRAAYQNLQRRWLET